MTVKNLIIAIVLGTSLASGIFVASNLTRPVLPQSALIIPTPTELPEFELVSHRGDPVNANSFRGQWDLLFFGFTQCPDICPTTLQFLATIKKQLVESGSESAPRIVLVSVDPERDTPELLARYVDYFGAGNLGVTGDLPELVKLTSALGIYFEKASMDGDNYTVNHSAAVLVIDPQGRFSALFSAPHIADDYLHDLPIVMGSN